MNYNDLTDEQMAKARECKTAEELVALSKAEGIELTDEQLEGISGGGWTCGKKDHSNDPL